jgi:uncharacterized protein (TIGR02186 family)
MRFIAFLALFTLTAVTAQAEQVVAALSQNRVSINANFDGSEILVFGAIKREEAAPKDNPLDVIVTVTGPERTETVRKKDRRAGIWINVGSEVIGHAPTFYTVFSTRTVEDIVSHDTDALWQITANERIFPNLKNNPSREALLRIRTQDGIYSHNNNGVDLVQETLFNASIALPANIVEGSYTTRILLMRGGKVLDDYSTEIEVQKVGIERWLYALAHENALAYGVLSLLLAAFAGWGASEAFRLLRR